MGLFLSAELRFCPVRRGRFGNFGLYLIYIRVFAFVFVLCRGRIRLVVSPDWGRLFPSEGRIFGRFGLPARFSSSFFEKKRGEQLLSGGLVFPLSVVSASTGAAFFGPKNPSSELFSGKSPLLSGVANRLSELQLSEARAWGSRPPARQRGVIRLRPPEGRIFGWSVNCRFTTLL